MTDAQYSLKARDDLIDIGLYISRENPPAADRTVDHLQDVCDRLASSPDIGTTKSDFGADLRSFAVQSYVIFYRPMPGGITILRILHGSRDLPSLFEQS